MTAIELVIFDCDGTLMDTEVLVAEVETEMLAEYGSTLSVQEFAVRFAGTSTDVVKKTMEEELGRALPDDYVARVKGKVNERLWREAKPMDGAQQVLDMFDQPRCICSNAGLEKLKIELTRGELWDRFRPYVFSARDTDNVAHKPAPDIFLHAASQFGVEPQACAVIEDSVTGVTGAKAAGMRTIGFVGGSHAQRGLADELTDAGAETVVKKLTDIPPVLEALALWNEEAS